jgi:hypothetical protein
MGALRTFLLNHRGLAFAILLMTLCMKAIVPAGTMIGAKTLTIEVCADASGQHQTRQISVPMTGKSGDADTHKAAGSCAYSALSLALLGGADPLLLALALAFIIALGFHRAPPRRLARTPHLRPPLRGPPSLA